MSDITSRPSGRVLVVDDSATAVELIEGTLASAGYEVRTAGSATEAFAVLREFSPDAIVLDVRMPRIDGIEMCRMLKRDPLLAPIPVLFITANEDDEVIIRGFDVGACDFVVKGVHPRILLHRVNNAVATYLSHRVERQLSADRLATSQTLAAALVEGLVSHKLTGFATLASGLAHEINNPLAAALSDVAFGRREDVTQLERDEALSAAIDSLRRVAGIVQRMQLLGSDIASTGVVSLDQVAEAVVVPASLTLAARRIQLHPELGRTRAVLGGARLAPVVTELIDNSARAVRDGDAIWVRTYQDGDHAVLEVLDRGCGMEADVKARAFAPFFTTKNDWRAIGLGLPMCHSVVTRLGGTIDLDSKPGEGTHVVLRLPNYRPT